jgi:hypothetical protein
MHPSHAFTNIIGFYDLIDLYGIPEENKREYAEIIREAFDTIATENVRRLQIAINELNALNPPDGI